MDYTKEDNAKTAEVLKEKLNLTRLPVAIKFFNDESEIPEGIEITPISFWLSTNSALKVLWALDEPNNTPSGTIVIHLPPIFSILIIKATNNNSVFFVLVIAKIDADVESSGNAPAKGGLFKERSNCRCSW